MRYLILVVVGFCLLCGWLVVESGLFDDSSQAKRDIILLQNVAGNQESETPNAPETDTQQLEAVDSITYGADHAPPKTVILGATDPNTEDPKTGYKFQLELSSKGASIRKATFSNGNNNGFDNRDPKNPQPLVIISPLLGSDGSEVLAMANKEFELVESTYRHRLKLNDLHWKSFDAETSPDHSQTACFEAIIKVESTGEPVMKLTKIYKIRKDSYLLDCDITIENIGNVEREVRFNL